MHYSIAFGRIDYEISRAPEWGRAQIHRLARHLEYRIVWPDARSALRVADQARDAGAVPVILLAPDHLSPLELYAGGLRLVETLVPRLSFARWAFAQVGR
ncbi:hypothetical protein IU421_04855 [Nocardia cyriacigeorgica]|uniref:hypothetical protein n=1 Tax=Nocardia cyriacigeorgica TaxID=135487 RepID=UPI00189585E1|nr:hypothetical protein [Nocardia cyriacigeorgica]MBF6158986.1 hypothetical protein [Nocardia cyriacigeorgica]MBF6197328.1 hypothetical protein [Nocardia cyriacigeorgica]MBF6319003.1 hypothetical protein [Nocardia cyriacigeorgica]MBF6513610.1 hypothetical protein [Nocardia cyriacigeorgica]MBF6531486.1 hypothetical protein [Nocardia cyriacigeorgica]